MAIKIHDLENQQYQAYSQERKTQERKTQDIMETLSEKFSEEGLTEIVGVRWLPDGTEVEYRSEKLSEEETLVSVETLPEKLSEEETLVSVETLSEKLSEEGLTEVVGVRWLPDGTGVEYRSEKLSEEGLTEIVGVRWLPDGTGVELVD